VPSRTLLLHCVNDQIDYIWCKLLESAKAPEADVLRVQDFLNLARHLNNPVVVVEEDLLHTLIPGKYAYMRYYSNTVYVVHYAKYVHCMFACTSSYR
jgi:hypothetical protein